VSIEHRGGSWRVRWREAGVHCSRTFALKRDALAWEREVRRRQQLGPLAVAQLTARGGPTLGEWIADRWAPEHAAQLAASTRERYADVYQRHIAPALDAVPLVELTAPAIAAWQSARLRAGAGPETIRKARTLLSSVLRHAVEHGALAANPVSSVRAPRAAPREAVTPLSPAQIERVRYHLAHPAAREVAASAPGQRRRRRYQLPAPGSARSHQLDALIVSLLGYAGLRPGELRALRWCDVREGTLLVRRAANPDGSPKTTKNRGARSVRLLAPLAQDLREYRLAAGRPPDNALILRAPAGGAWDKNAWQCWRADRWAPACRAAGLNPVPRPYDLRHSFASLLLAAGHQPLFVAAQLGHSPAVLLATYAHLIAEYEATARPIDPEAEIAAARQLMYPNCAQNGRQAAAAILRPSQKTAH